MYLHYQQVGHPMSEENLAYINMTINDVICFKMQASQFEF
jgi:hypothetical protein